MEKEFVPYEQSLALKELGFDEPCLGLFYFNAVNGEPQFLIEERGSQYSVNKGYAGGVLAPIYRQSFNWFREKHNLYSEIDLDSYKEPYLLKITIKQLDETNCFVTKSYYPNCIDGVDTFNNKQYEKAELECLKKLIEIVKEKKDGK
tara:strand:+ start:14885 stop:15325 length:441 start_codon:yes stop_codon:yes gene_type:complete